jgi:CRISPR/Cas system-associated exonuclease Cas4 (RecB family)
MTQHISYSSLHSFACPYANFLRYEGKLRGPTTRWLALGSALHLALELTHTPEKDFILNDAITIFKVELSRIIHDDEVFIKYPDLIKTQAEGTEMLGLYQHGLDTGKISVLVRDVEKEFSLPFEGIDVVGKIDKVEDTVKTIDPHDDDGYGYTIVDYKSGSKKPDLWFLDHNLQFTAYAWAGLLLYGELPTKLVWHHLRTGELLETTRTLQDIEELKQMIRDTQHMREQGIRYRVYHEQVCGYCEFSGMGQDKSTICDDRELEKRLVAQVGKYKS